MRKILVVDDSRTVRLHLVAALTSAGYEVLEAVDGVEGCEAIARHRDLSMVICDVNMPRMTGLDLLTTVKRQPQNAALPIMMLTTEGQSAQIEHAKQAGAKGWMVKPFVPEVLLTTVRRLIGGAPRAA
jgi:two-component system chemotaxis response regulator CheY